MTPDQFCAYLALQGLSDATLRNYRALYVRWLDWCATEGRNPTWPDPLAVRAWSKTVKGSRSMIDQARAMVGHMCRALQVDEVQAAIPVPPDRKMRAYRGLEHDVAVALAATAETAGLAGTAVLVALYTSARRGEVASLAWHRVDFDRRLVTLERPKVRDLHTVPLHTRLVEHLAVRHLPGDYWVFPGRHGGHVSPATIWRWVDQVAEQAGVGHVTPHQLRHTSLTEANDATGDLRAVQDMAGHSDPSVTARYTRQSEQRLRAAVESLDFTTAQPAG